MLLRIVGIIFPIFIIVLLGFVYGRRQRPDMLAANQLNLADNALIAKHGAAIPETVAELSAEIARPRK